jgi:hypothetical protein
MSDKSPTEYADTSHDEKNIVEQPRRESEVRRKSIALNVVENPLRVRIFPFTAAPRILILILFVARISIPGRRRCALLCRSKRHV